MRGLALILVVAAAVGCARRSLQDDAGGSGTIGRDGGGVGTEGIGGSNSGLPGADANCGMTSLTGAYVAPIVMVLLDQSVSGDRSRWNDLLTALSSTITVNDTRIDWGLYTFPEPGPACGAGTASAMIDVPVRSMNAASITGAINGSTPNASGSPTAAAVEIGAMHLRAQPAERPRYLLLVTDAAPSCAGPAGQLSSDAAQAQADAIAAIGTAAAAGISTLVLAPSTTAPGEIASLNALAEAGGRAASPSAINFMTETSLPEVFATPDISCTFPLREFPPVPDIVSVVLNGAPVPRDHGPHMSGWDYVESSLPIIEFYGYWCEQLTSSPSFEIDIFYGCPAL